MSKTIQCRLSDEAFEKLQSIIPFFNEGEYEQREKRRELINYHSWGKVTSSDVIRFAIDNQVDVIQSRILNRTTSPRDPGERNTRRPSSKRNTRSRRGAKR